MNWLLYGANGYTGELAARHAAGLGLRPILAGRNPEQIGHLATELGLEARVFGLDDAASVQRQLAGVGAVLNCAGPFSRTATPMADACLAAGAHYLDITGEIAVFEGLAARSAQAKAAGVMFLPGVGFDVVPSDCLAAHLARRLPSATHLVLALRALGRPSRGTTLTMIENIDKGGMVRRGGRLTRVPAAWRTRAIDFGTGPMTSVTIPWGDVATAFYSTGIPEIEVYAEMPAGMRWAMAATRSLGWVFALAPVKSLLERRVRAQAPGPTEAQRARASSVVWGQVEGRSGRTATSRLRTPDGYTLTVLSATAVVQRVLAGDARPGFQTPSLAYGPDFVLEIPGVVREDVE